MTRNLAVDTWEGRMWLSIAMAKSMEKQATIAQSMSLQSQQGMKTTEAELKMAVLATSSNIILLTQGLVVF